MTTTNNITTEILSALPIMSSVVTNVDLSEYLKKTDLSNYLVLVDELPEEQDPEKVYFVKKRS